MKRQFLFLTIVLCSCCALSSTADQFDTVVGQASTSLRGVDGVVSSDGILYLAWIDAGTLRLALSYDNGGSWFQQNINTPQNGTYATRMGGLQMVVDHFGRVFILTNVYFGTGGYGQEFYYKIYCITNASGTWQEELVLDYLTYRYRYDVQPDGFYYNNIAIPFDAFCDVQGNVRVFMKHHGWWSYGGEIFELVRSAGASGTWGALSSVCHIRHPNVDFQSNIYEQAVQKSDGGVVIVAVNRDGDTNTDLPVEQRNRFAFYVEREAGGEWSDYQIFGAANNYEGSKGNLNIDVDQEDNIHVLYVNPSFTDLLYTRNWGPPEVVATIPTANERFNTCFLDAEADGLLTVGYSLYNTVTTSYTRYPSLIERDGFGPWSSPVTFSSRVGSLSTVTGVARFDMFHGGSFEGALKWCCWGPATYPMSLVYLQDEPRKVEPSFRLEVLNPTPLFSHNEQPRFQIAVLPENGFNQKVHLFSNVEWPPTRLTAETVTPPGTTTVVMERLEDGHEPMWYDLAVWAESEDGTILREVFIDFEIFGDYGEVARLALRASDWKVRIGDSLKIYGRLLPGLEGETINFDVQNFGIPHSPGITSGVNSTTTGHQGFFTWDFSPVEPGSYGIKATWDGIPDVLPPTESDPIYIEEILPRQSKISLRIPFEGDVQVDAAIPFVCRVSPAPAGDIGTAEFIAHYGIQNGDPLDTETQTISFTNGEYQGTFTPTREGLAELRCHWMGEGAFSEGAETPPVILSVSAAGSSSEKRTIAASMDPGMCILVAGVSSDQLPTNVRDYLNNLSYSVLQGRRFTKPRLKYVNDVAEQDVTWDGQDDGVVDIVESSASAVNLALNQVASSVGASAPVSLFLVADRGEAAELLMNDGTRLSASALDAQLTSQLGTTREIRIVVEASHSGAFCQALIASNRTIISSARAERASFASGGLLSFSQLFWTNVQYGWDLKKSFENARDYLNAVFGYYGAPKPMFIAASDYEPNYQFYGISADAEDMFAPDIDSIFQSTVVESPGTAVISARVSDDVGVHAVSATIRKPDGTTTSVPMQLQDATTYSAQLGSETLSQLGVYLVSIVAIDEARNASVPRASEIVVINRADLNSDGKVNAQDLCILIAEMDSPTRFFDIIEDGQLDFLDFLEIARRWDP